MDDDWEALAEKENVVIAAPKIKNINKWEGEDEDEDVKESWEEEEEEKKDEEKSKEDVKPAANAKTKSKKLQSKISEKEREAEENVEQEKIELTPEEKLAEKLRLQKIQEEEDLKTAMDTFGVTEVPPLQPPTSGIDGMQPTNKIEFSEFAEAISDKVSLYKNAEEFPGFVEELLRSICANLQAAELKKIKMTVDNLYLEKQKIEKEKTKKPSGKGKTKVKLRVEEDNVKTNNIGDYGYGDYDDYDDFM